MFAKSPKKLIIMNILDILKRYTDENHRLSQKKIQDILEREYDMTVERKAVKRNLMNLIEFGYNINYSESVRIFKDKDGKEQENVILSDFYLEREFTDSELRLLIDSVLFSNHIPYKQDKELVDKLASLSNIYFKKRVNHIARMPEDEYHTDKKLHKRRNKIGKVREYIINPYQLVAKEGKYYLICNYDKYDNISNYRVDRITDLEILDENIKPFDRLKGSDGRKLDLEEYMDKHVYMFSGENIDMFGKEVRFSEESDDAITVTVNVNELAMEQFAKAFTPWVEVIKPVALRERMIKNLNKGLEKYVSNTV